MPLDASAIVHIAGILAAVGALVYALSDVLLLGHAVGPRGPVAAASEADLAPYAAPPFSAGDLLKLTALPPRRLAWGGVLGVLATPLLLLGLWPLCQALRPAGWWQAFLPAALLATGLILAPFVHGSFIYIEQNAQVLARLSPEERPILGEVFRLQQRVMATAYAVVAVATLLASLLYSIVVAVGTTGLPRWMAAVNPVTMVITWMLIRRLLPERVARYSEGAGFNIGFFLFFGLLTVTLW